MVPLSVLNITIKSQGSTYTTPISGEKFNILGVFTIFKCIGSAARARKCTGFNIDGDPLKSFTTLNLQGTTRTKGRIGDFIPLLTTGHAPDTGQRCPILINPTPSGLGTRQI